MLDEALPLTLGVPTMAHVEAGEADIREDEEEIMEHLGMSRDRVRYRLKKAREKFVQLYNRSGL